ncbi:hypothetical protein DS524_25470 [Salmonella enterica subsp. enterica serovar Chester]|uniref:Uncharacterized protein n=1 Tax=Salmonella enterica subsp. enterica serovar Chester TaxID=149386 RepID=A0A5U8SZZ2_SALET|nr:hypothetical protein [Salmonella enterica subsp. enterica serovar Chester]
MIYSNVKTYYISDDATGGRLVRYDVITISSDEYLIKVFDDQQRSISPPHSIILVDEFKFTRSEYMERNNIGNNSMIRRDMAPSFESDILNKCKEHRNSLK